MHSLPKQGLRDDENEDCCAYDLCSGRFAIADGASTSARAEVWSWLLVESFVHECRDPLDPADLEVLRQRWWNRVWNPELPWFAQEKLFRGAAAAFASLTITDREYQVRAVGDSCVFHLRDSRILVWGPVVAAERFTRFPELIQAGPEPARSVSRPWSAAGSFESGDVLLLATDTVAKSLLQGAQRGHPSWLWARLASRGHFDRFVSDIRSQGMNDDMTICVVMA